MPPKKPPTPSRSSVKKVQPDALSVEDLAAGISDLKIAKAVAYIELPMLQYSWRGGDGKKHLSLDILLFSGVQAEHVTCKIKDGGMAVLLEIEVPFFPFWNKERLFMYNDQFTDDSARSAAMEEATQSFLKRSMDGGFIYPVNIELEFPVEEDFCEIGDYNGRHFEQYYPYGEDDERYSDKNASKEGMYYHASVFYIELLSKEKNQALKEVKKTSSRKGIPGHIFGAPAMEEGDTE